MGELLDALNELDERASAPAKPSVSFADLAARIFRSASRTVNEAIEVLQEPNMPLDMLSRWTRRRRCQRWLSPFWSACAWRDADRGDSNGSGILRLRIEFCAA
jgi:hypothetical protein